MKSRQTDDKAEGLWRIHDKLYDLRDFVDLHPGGKDWIRFTEGTDITEAFEVHHVYAEKAEKLLDNFYVREATQPRNFKLTFNENGFYRTFKRRAAEKLLTVNRTPELISKVLLKFRLIA